MAPSAPASASASSPSPSAPAASSELRRLLARSPPGASDPGAHPQDGARPSAAEDAALASRLERALLRTWRRLLSDPHSGSPLARSFDRRSWRRLALLLFSGSQRLVSAAAAVIEAALYPLRGGQAEADAPPRQLRRERWAAARSAALLGCVCDKLQDCRAALDEPAGNQRGGPVRPGGVDDPTAAVAARLVHVLGAAVATALEERRPTDCPAGLDDADARALALLHDISEQEPSRPSLPARQYLHLLALRELRALQLQTRSPVEAALILPAPLLLLYVGHVVEITLAASACSVTLLSAVDSLRVKCCGGYLDLLAGATPNQLSLPAVESVLATCDALLVAADVSLQLAALRWLRALLDSDRSGPSHRVDYAEALARALRLSGALRTLSWLLLHSDPHVRDQAAAVLALVERHSPPVDLARTLIEQGCIAICRVVVEQQQCGRSRDPGADMAAHLLDWARRELGELRPFLVRACCHAVRHSTNAALRVNVVLALHILRSGGDGRPDCEGIRAALQAENFVEDVLLPAIEDGESQDGASAAGFARALLAMMANTCDPLSLLKLERGASRRSSSSVLNISEATSTESKTNSNQSFSICCANGVIVSADLDLMAANSALVRRHLEATNSDQSTPLAAQGLTEDAVRILLKLLSPLSTAVLASEGDAALLDVLAASRTLETPSVWHLSARTLSDRLSADNWVHMALGALSVRHPALVVRAVRHGVSTSSSDADLMRVAVALAREFFRDW